MTLEILSSSRTLPRLLSLSRHVPGVLGLLAVIKSRLPTRGALAELPPVPRYTIVGLAGLTALVGVITVVGIIVVELAAALPLTWFGSGTASSPSVDSRKAVTYEHVTTRPIFSRTRQGSLPVAAAAPAIAPTPSMSIPLDQSIVFRGVFINGSSAKAFLTSTQNPTGGWVWLNGEISGWRLVSVKPDQVILEGQGQTLTLKRSVVAR